MEKQKRATNLVKPSYDSLQNKEAELSKTNVDIEASQKQLLDIQSKVTEAEVRLKECEENLSKLEELKKTIHDIDNENSKYDQREKLIITIGELNAQSDELKKREDKHKKAEDDLSKSIEDIKLKVEGLKGKPDELNSLKFNLEKLNTLIGEIYAIVKDGGRYSEYCDKLKQEEETEKQHQEIDKEYNEITKKRSAAQEEYKHNLYGILARDLQEGKPCPVCGNKHHPEPATLAKESVWTQKDIDELIAQEDAVKKNKDELLKKSTQAKATLEEYANSLKADMIKCLNSDLCSVSFDDSTTMDEFKSMLTVEYDKLCDIYKKQQEKQKALEVDCTALIEASSQLELARGEKTIKLNKDKEELEAKKRTIESDLAASKALVKDFEKLRYPNLEAAQKARKDAETEMNTIEESIKKATSDKQKIDKDKDNLEGTISALQKTAAEQANAIEKLEDEFCKKLADNGFKDVEDFKVYIVTQECISKSDNDLAEYDKKVFNNENNLERIEKELDGKEEQDMQCLENGVAEKKQMVDRLTEQSIKLDGIIASNEKILGNIRDKKPRIESAKKESSMYDRLYKLISGTVKVADGVKISFEQYIQAAGFDDILRAANIRLKRMTDNRYELFRRDDNKSNKFLDLMVKDYNISGKKRLVGNLSGGESFMASLSLALGLSDVVSSRAGGAFVEALFIDEGFGTLDKNTLEKTMDVLLNLANSNKLVGVISHREEMKDNIPQQIRITKTTKGSTLAIDTGF